MKSSAALRYRSQGVLARENLCGVCCTVVNQSVGIVQSMIASFGIQSIAKLCRPRCLADVVRTASDGDYAEVCERHHRLSGLENMLLLAIVTNDSVHTLR